MAKDKDDSFSFEIKEDLGSFGDGKWLKHLTLISWNGNPPTYDLRTWNEDMSKCGKGITLTKEDLIELSDIITDLLEK